MAAKIQVKNSGEDNFEPLFILKIFFPREEALFLVVKNHMI